MDGPTALDAGSTEAGLRRYMANLPCGFEGVANLPRQIRRGSGGTIWKRCTGMDGPTGYAAGSTEAGLRRYVANSPRGIEGSSESAPPDSTGGTVCGAAAGSTTTLIRLRATF